MALNQKVWLITGTSTGLGRHLVHSVLARGDKVIATARTLEKIQDLKSQSCKIMQVDVTDDVDTIKAKAAEAIAMWGRVDVLVNNAGLGIASFTEDAGYDGYMKQFQPNFFGPLNVTNAFLPHMRERRQGTIVFVSSRSSFRTNLPMIGPYAASKAALNAAAEALTAELAPLGIRVLPVLPGGLRTANWANMQVYGASPREGSYGTEGLIADYAAVRDAILKFMYGQDGKQVGDAKKAADAIVDVVRAEGLGAKATADGAWPGLLALGEDAEVDIRDKCHKVLKDLDEWQGVTRSIAIEEK